MRKRDEDIVAGMKRFSKKYDIKGKGPLSVVLVLTRSAKSIKPPYSEKHFLTHEGGQVAGLGQSAVQSILKEHGIQKVLAKEGGRTSRGSIRRMQGYLQLLNELHKKGALDLNQIEEWWIKRINDQSKSITQLIIELMATAYKRQQAQKGTMVAGAVMQHLVGAKLEIALPNTKLSHKGFSVADESRADQGDFALGDCVIHVTAAPSEALIQKCQSNLDANLRPIIITSEEGVGGAKALAKSLGAEDRIEVFEISQFIALNVYEWGSFKESERPPKMNELVESYNKIVELVETDHSLKIQFG
jgi:hypothetical protein